MFLTWASTDKLLVIRGGPGRVFESTVCVWSFFFLIVDCQRGPFLAFQESLKLCVIGVIFSKLFPLAWLWQVLEAQRRHQKEKFGIIPTSPTPYTYNKVGEELFFFTFWVAPFQWAGCGPLGTWFIPFLSLNLPVRKAGSSHPSRRVLGIQVFVWWNIK